MKRLKENFFLVVMPITLVSVMIGLIAGIVFEVVSIPHSELWACFIGFIFDWIVLSILLRDPHFHDDSDENDTKTKR